MRTSRCWTTEQGGIKGPALIGFKDDVLDEEADSDVESEAVKLVRLDVSVADELDEEADASSSGPCVEATTHNTPRVNAAVQVANVVRRATGSTRMEGGAKWNQRVSMAAFSTPLMP